MPDYYQTHCNDYFKRTVCIDSSPFLNSFVHKLSPGASVLDIGCGSGRDLLMLRQQGFVPTGFERSKGLASLARGFSGCNVMEGDFETFDFSKLSFDAILASGALVHIPHHRLAGVLTNIKQALAPSGIFYLSVKQGDNTHTQVSGRTFYFWRDQAIRNLFPLVQMKVVFFSISRSALNEEDQWLSYILRPF